MKGRQSWWLPVLLHCLLPLAAGALVYLFFRSGNHLSSFLQNLLRVSPRIPASGWGRVFANSFPDFCWSYSFSAALLLYAASVSWSRGVALFLALLLVAFSEGVQLLLADGFTFDYLDLLAALAGCILSVLLLSKTFYAKKA